MIIKSSLLFLKKNDMEINIKLGNGQILRGIIKSPGDNVRAVMILVHGLGDHVKRYSHWIERFSAKGIGFLGVDLPGHGRSDGKRGNIKNYTITNEMLNIMITEYKKTFPGIPVFLYGHSMGGGIVLEYILRNNPEITGAIVTSPWLRLPVEPNRTRLLLARALKHLLPSLVQPSGLIVNHISHDKAVVDDYNSDPLVHNKISVSLFHSAVSAAGYSLNNAKDLKVPILLIHGSDDLITSPEGSREFASKTNMAEFKLWDGGYHELHNEPFKDEVFSYIVNWIEKQI
jgi:alpha-beta hydrolase superfamily lysophospholipase